MEVNWLERSDGAIFDGASGGAAPYVWRHLHRSAAAERELVGDPQVPDRIVWAMLEKDIQPRVIVEEGVVGLFLRGINQEAGSEPEDMISIRLAIGPSRILSVELRRLRIVDRLIDEFRKGKAPATVNDFVIHLMETLREEAEPVLDALEGDIAHLEHRSAGSGGRLDQRDRAKLADARQDAIILHRFIAPQASALESLARMAPPWLTDRGTVHEEAEAFRRIAGDLEAVRSRGQIVADELANANAEQTNRIVLLLSVVSVVFLPLTFLTGLFGVNLGGIPGATEPLAFGLFTGALVIVGVATALVAGALLR